MHPGVRKNLRHPRASLIVAPRKPAHHEADVPRERFLLCERDRLLGPHLHEHRVSERLLLLELLLVLVVDAPVISADTVGVFPKGRYVEAAPVRIVFPALQSG
jgi:hypothetical protein